VSVDRQQHGYEPLFDIHPATGASIEVFYADSPPGASLWVAPAGFGTSDGAVLRPMAGAWTIFYELLSVSRRDEIGAEC
jgi:hypothetical protein